MLELEEMKAMVDEIDPPPFNGATVLTMNQAMADIIEPHNQRMKIVVDSNVPENTVLGWRTGDVRGSLEWCFIASPEKYEESKDA